MLRRILVVVALCGTLLAVPSPVMAASQPTMPMAANCGTGVGAFLLLKPWHACLEKDGNGNPQIKRLTDIWLILLPLLEGAIKVAGYVAAGFIIWGGIKYLKSQGDPGQLNEARLVIHNALFGLLLAMISVALVNFIAGAF